jgi:hypothetical protein
MNILLWQNKEELLYLRIGASCKLVAWPFCTWMFVILLTTTTLNLLLTFERLLKVGRSRICCIMYMKILMIYREQRNEILEAAKKVVSACWATMPCPSIFQNKKQHRRSSVLVGPLCPVPSYWIVLAFTPRLSYYLYKFLLRQLTHCICYLSIVIKYSAVIVIPLAKVYSVSGWKWVLRNGGLFH